MTITRTLKKEQQPTEEQIKEVQEAAKREPVYDEDCPELTPTMLKSLRCAVRQRNRLLNETKAQ